MRGMAIVCGVCFILVAFVYRRTPTAFLRAESGYYLRMAHADARAQQEFRAQFFTQAQNGHYTPLFFVSEFETAKLFGTNRTLWEWRQIVGVAVYAALAFSALRGVAGIFPVGQFEELAVASAVSALAIFHPCMADLVSWPFMIAQLAWLALLMIALLAVVRLTIRQHEERWSWIAAVAATLSLQISGLGFVTVAAVGGAFIVVMLHRGETPHGDEDAVPTPNLAPAFLLLGCMTAVHAWLTIHSLAAPDSSIAGPPVHGLAAVKLLLAFAFNFAAAGVRMFSLTSTDGPSVLSIAYCWPLGILLLAAALFGITAAINGRNTHRRARLSISVGMIFSVAGFFALVALIAAREIAAARGTGGLAPYFNFFLVTPRYLVPLQALFLGPAALLLAWTFTRTRRAISIGCCVAVVAAAVLTQLEFQHGPMKSLLPGTRVSDYTTWRLLLTVARECRTAGLPLPNLPLRALSREMPADVQWFLPIIKHDLGLQPDDNLDVVEWPLPANVDAGQYVAVPSLQELEQKLDLHAARE